MKQNAGHPGQETAAIALAASLRRHGVDTLFGQSLPSALHLVAPEFDLLVTDQTMPGPIQGMDLAHQVREALGEIPIVILTGYGTDALDSFAGLSKFTLLNKPVIGPVLISKIRSLLDS